MYLATYCTAIKDIFMFLLKCSLTLLASAYEQLSYDIYKRLEISFYFLNTKFSFMLGA